MAERQPIETYGRAPHNRLRNAWPILLSVFQVSFNSLLLPNNKEKKTAKGVKKSCVAKNIRHDHYKQCLFDDVTTTAKFCRIQSQRHNLHTAETTKIALSPYDDKRYLISNRVSYAYGHVNIPSS